MCHEELPSADFSRGAVYLTGAIQHVMGCQTLGTARRGSPAISQPRHAQINPLTRSTCFASSSSKEYPCCRRREDACVDQRFIPRHA